MRGIGGGLLVANRKRSGCANDVLVGDQHAVELWSVVVVVLVVVSQLAPIEEVLVFGVVQMDQDNAVFADGDLCFIDRERSVEMSQVVRVVLQVGQWQVLPSSARVHTSGSTRQPVQCVGANCASVVCLDS